MERIIANNKIREIIDSTELEHAVLVYTKAGQGSAIGMTRINLDMANCVWFLEIGKAMLLQEATRPEPAVPPAPVKPA